MGDGPSGIPWVADASGLLLTIRLTPKGGRDAIDGIAILSDGQPVLKIRVRAAPSEGEANAALIGLLARTLRVPAGQVGVVSGAAARLKRVRIAGDGLSLAKAMEKIAPSG